MASPPSHSHPPPTAPPQGTFAPPLATDVRGPCPVINALANHGYLPRTGRGIRTTHLKQAMHAVGLSRTLSWVLSTPIFLERRDLRQSQGYSLLSSFLYMLRHPWSWILWSLGMRRPGQFDAEGHAVLNLDQLALHGAVEHDVSLTRLDIAQGDNTTRQGELVDALLESQTAKDTSLMSARDFAVQRGKRHAEQEASNPGLVFGGFQNQIACGEIALILDVFGDGECVRREWAEAVFREERLPVEEGWCARRNNPLGWRELQGTVGMVKGLVEEERGEKSSG